MKKKSKKSFKSSASSSFKSSSYQYKFSHYKGNEHSKTCWNCGNEMIYTKKKSVTTYYCETCKRYWRNGEIFEGK